MRCSRLSAVGRRMHPGPRPQASARSWWGSARARSRPPRVISPLERSGARVHPPWLEVGIDSFWLLDVGGYIRMYDMLLDLVEPRVTDGRAANRAFGACWLTLITVIEQIPGRSVDLGEIECCPVYFLYSQLKEWFAETVLRPDDNSAGASLRGADRVNPRAEGELVPASRVLRLCAGAGD